MRKHVRDFVKFCTEHLPLAEPVYEFGSLQVPGGGPSDMRPFFPDKEFVGADLRAGPGVDVILDLHAIDLAASSAGTVLILDTLEHVEFVRKAMDEMRRILVPEGILIASSVMKFHIHCRPEDYWRFTPTGFKSLFQPFADSVVVGMGDPNFPHTVLGVGFREGVPLDVVGGFRYELTKWLESQP